jgi:hypothetical protein
MACARRAAQRRLADAERGAVRSRRRRPGFVQRRRVEAALDFTHYLALAGTPEAAEQFDRAFNAGALLTLGDALQAHAYFDHALELTYHLRNGVAHGNRFTFTPPGEKRLAKHPAHNRRSYTGDPSTGAAPTRWSSAPAS